MKTRSRGRGRMAGAGSIKGPSPDARRRARLPKSVMRIAIGPPRWLRARSIRLPSASCFGRLLLAERHWPLPRPLDAAMLGLENWRKSGRCWLLRPSDADRSEGDYETFVDWRCGYDGAHALARQLWRVGTEIGRHPQDA